MRFLILGPLKVVDGDRPVALTGRRKVMALAVLLANAGQVVPREYLVDAVWDDAPPTTARRQIQNEISNLRRALSGGGSGETAIVTDGHGYRIVPRPGELDAQVFTDLVAEALDLAGRDAPAAVAKLRSALRLWRGPALLGLSGRAVEAVAARLAEQRLAAAEECFDLELALGKQGELVGELAELVAKHPLRERLVGQLMLALHGSGRQSEALAAHDRLRTQLADELGLTPGAPLQQLHIAILRDDPDVHQRSATAGAAIAAPVVPAQLPADVPGFTGRADHLRRLDELLPERRGRAANAVVISAIAGTAGVGKTALAVHWGHQVGGHFPDGQLYINLRGFAADAPVRPVEALAHLLRSLGEPAEQIPVDEQTAAGRYRSLLAGRQVLVLLDNAASADQVRPLLPGSSGCLVLVTSRERLTGLLARDGAGSLPLDVLSSDEARNLLATILGPDRVAAEPVATAELARICSHLPLALRVAAANLTSHPWPRIADYVAALRDGDRLTELDVDGDEQAGVRRAFDLSYRTLHHDTRRVFRLLGLAPGTDITVEAVAALAATSTAHARRLLERLIAVHMVNHPVLGRYTCHDLLRHYAAERARAEDTAADREAALLRLHNWYLHCADRAARMLYGQSLRLSMPAVDVPTPAVVADEAAALAWLDAERSNLVAVIRQAAEHGPRSHAWLLADALRGYFWLGMHILDWQSATQTALASAESEGDLRAQAAAQLSLGDSHFRQNRRELAIERYEAALTLAERTGWTQCEAAALCQLGVMYRDSGQVRHANDYFDRGLKLFRANGWRHGEAVTLIHLGRAYLQLGRLAEAIECCAAALTINRAIGSRLGEGTDLSYLGEFRYAQGRLDEAAEHLTDALPLLQELGDRTNEAAVLRVLAAVRSDQGAIREAAEFGQAALALARELGERRIEAEVLNTLGALAHRTGRHRDAVEHHERALELTRATGDQYPETEALIGLTAEHLCLGHRDQAIGLASRALAIACQAEYGLLEERTRAIIGALRS